jgi:hypothetical protein
MEAHVQATAGSHYVMECDDEEFNELNATGLKRRIHMDSPAGTPLPRSYTSQYSVRKV